MNTTDLIRALRGKLAHVDAELAALTVPIEDAGSIQFGKRAGDATNVAADQLARVSAHEQLLAMRDEITRALHKHDEGTAERCDDCGNAIPAARLEALPWAVRCVQCQAALSGREGAQRGRRSRPAR